VTPSQIRLHEINPATRSEQLHEQICYLHYIRRTQEALSYGTEGCIRFDYLNHPPQPGPSRHCGGFVQFGNPAQQGCAVGRHRMTGPAKSSQIYVIYASIPYQSCATSY